MQMRAMIAELREGPYDGDTPRSIGEINSIRENIGTI